MKRAVQSFWLLVAVVGWINSSARADSPSTQPVVSAANLDSSITSALVSLQNGTDKQAIELFTAASKMFPKSVQITDSRQLLCFNAMACSYMRLGSNDKAREVIERAYRTTIEKPRSLVLNRAKLDLIQKGNELRAVRELNELVARFDSDEDVVNLFGCAIDQAATRLKSTQQVDTFIARFQQAEAKLEQARPGMKHWGTRWVGGQEWADISKARSEASWWVDKRQRELADAERGLKSAKDEYDSSRRQAQLGGSGETQQMRDAKSRMSYYSREVEQCRSRLAQANANMPRPTWSADLKPVLPEEAAGNKAAPANPQMPVVSAPVSGAVGLKYQLIPASG